MAFRLTLARSYWLKLHLYLALSVGALFALIGLTGSLSVYGENLDRLFNPRLVIRPAGQSLSLDTLMAAVRARHPDNRGAWTLELPRAPDQPLTAWYEKPIESVGQFYAPLMVAVNPYTGEILASRLWGDTLRTWLRDWHTRLNLGRWGSPIVGMLGLCLMVSAVSGLYLWWPGIAGLRARWGLRTDAGLQRFSLDLHRWLGLLVFPLLLLQALTGFNLSFPSVGEALVGTQDMGHGDNGPEIRSTGLPSANRPVSLDEAVLLARGPFPRSPVRLLTTPADAQGTYRVAFQQPMEPSDRHPMTVVWVDQYSGQIREVRNAARFSSGERLLTTLWPLHTGGLVGSIGKLLWFLTGLALPVLYVTGLIRWLIGRGAIPDRPVDVRPVQQWLTRNGQRAGVAIGRVYSVARPGLERAWTVAATQLRALWAMLRQRLQI